MYCISHFPSFHSLPALSSPEPQKTTPLTQHPQLPGRPQFKHVLFAPSPHNALAGDVFPFVRAAIEKRDWDAAAKAIKMTADKLAQAADALMH